MVKYGFELKKWFVNRGSAEYRYSRAESWCNKIEGYRLPKLSDLTNASCRQEPIEHSNPCRYTGNEINELTATPSSPRNSIRRHIGAGFFTEWGWMSDYGANYFGGIYWTQDRAAYRSRTFLVYTMSGGVTWPDVHNFNDYYSVFCVYP